jgi:hypothetical protein
MSFASSYRLGLNEHIPNPILLHITKPFVYLRNFHPFDAKLVLDFTLFGLEISVVRERLHMRHGIHGEGAYLV